MAFRPVLIVLLSAALLLPIAELIMLSLARLLGVLGDATGAAVLDRVCLAGGILWGIDLVCLLVVVAAQSVPPPEPPKP